MSAKTRVVLLLVLLVSGTGLIGYLATRDPAPVPTGPGDRDKPVEVAPPPVAMGRPGTLTGIVRVFRTKEPAADIEVRIEGAGDPIVKKTNARGIFAARVPSGPEVTVTAYAPDPYADVVIHGVSVNPDATTSLGTLFLERALLVKGIVVDRAGNPVPGAAVAAHRPAAGDSPATDFMDVFTSMTKLRTPLDESVTGEDGRFELSKLSPGTYRIEAWAEGFAVGAVKKATVSPESVRVEHRIVLGPGAGLTGKVTTANGHPVPEALVSVVRMADDPLNPFAFSPVQATTDEGGLFSFENLSPGKASVAVRATGYPTTMLNDVNIGERDSLDVVLGGTASIRGRVTAGEGEGVEGATIMVAVGQRGGAFGETTTDADGRYRIEHLPEGRIQFMRVEAAGLASWPVFNNPMMFQKGFGELTAERELVKDIALSRGSRVFGRVTSEADGQPIGGASVYMMAAFSTFLGAVGEAVTDEDGNYEIVGVPRGLHQVVVRAAGFYQTGLNPMFMQRAFGMGMGNKAPENAPEVTTAEGGPDQHLDVALKTGAIAVGTVLTPDNEPVAGARVTVAAKPNP
ncbi:MAG: carboxypeptidase-like regulatory domain-containing protein, partial [Planctomycetota bacterium]